MGLHAVGQWLRRGRNRPAVWLALLLLVVTGGLSVRSCASAPRIWQPPARETLPADSVAEVAVVMHRVDYRALDSAVLHIRLLTGHLHPTGNAPPSFDDPRSFRIVMDTAVVLVDTASLGALLNGYVFAYRGSPLRQLSVSVEGRRLQLRGALHKLVDIPFEISAAVTLLPSGEIRLHPVSIDVFKLGVDGLLDFFGVQLDELVKGGASRGVVLRDNDFYLDAAALLPPPRAEGRVRALRLEPGALRLVFGPDTARPGPPVASSLVPPEVALGFRGAQLRFGKLTMRHTDMRIMDADTTDGFDFDLNHYRVQLVPGYTRTRWDDGLVVYMRDYGDALKEETKSGKD